MLIDSAPDPVPPVLAGFLHDAFVYRGDDEFLLHTASFVHDGVTNDEAVLVALPPAGIANLRSALGSAADQVTFIDITSAGRNPARIIPLWRNLLDQHPGRPVRGIGEPAYPGRSEAEFEEATFHEALLNVAFEHDGPFRLRCPYDVSMAGPAVAATHPPSFSRSSAEETFRTALPGVPAYAERLEFGLAELTAVRHWFTTRARLRGLSGSRLDDVALALQEICTNSIRFGGGRGTLSLWSEDGGLVLEVADRGRIDDLLIGRVLPPVEGFGGRGVWLANQLCDLVQIRSGAGFTQVRLHARPS
ncbi:sensor histidine kinase [Kribbella qitaiheensis]|uniref:Sensor histidine kinase n=1 Tax=Kribbella qitaiheensis TaxID=1544730 RepID=A0A7G6WUS9_9ACTN|nr:sensor histidine kinase [Kribbella qitaiheensis]QNE17744.1 sensor histidine kinase [Kribbella qitaiheensis]